MMGKETLETTVGDLIAALTEEVISFTRDEKEAYRLVAQMLTDLLNNSGSISKRWHWRQRTFDLGCVNLHGLTPVASWVR